MKFFGSVVFVTLAALGHGLVLSQVSQEQARQIIVEARSALDYRFLGKPAPGTWAKHRLGRLIFWTALCVFGQVKACWGRPRYR